MSSHDPERRTSRFSRSLKATAERERVRRDAGRFGVPRVLAKMLCQACKKKEALIHISTGSTARERSRRSKHFCRACADAYYVRAGMNSARGLIRLSDFYRFKLYDELEAEHPEAFDNSNDEACLRGTEVMCRFLKKRLSKENIKLNQDGFEMLFHDFFGSRQFYERAEKYQAKK